MLEYLRNASEKPLAKILIGILAFSFIGWGVAEWIFSGTLRDNSLVKVGSEKITIQDFNLEKSRELANMPREQQRSIYMDSAEMQKLTDSILSTLTAQKRVENRAKDLGFIVTNARVAHEISRFPEFQKDGHFSAYLFENMLRNSGYSEEKFADNLRKQILRYMVVGSLNFPVPVSDFALDSAYNARYGERQIDYATVNFSDFKVKNPTEEELKIFYSRNPRVIPEQRVVSYALVAADMMKPDNYDKAYEKAQRLEDDIISGEPMSKAAKKHEAKYVSLNPFSVANPPKDEILSDSVIAKIFKMDEGTESELLETKKGFAIMRVDKIIPQRNAEFESVRKSLASDWKKEEQKKQAYLRANELLVDLNKNGKLASKKSVRVSRTSGAPIEVLSAAFNTSAAVNSIIPSENAFYVMRIEKEITPKKDSKKVENLRKEMQTTLNREIAEDYNSFLIREYPAKTNKKLFKKFFPK